MKRKFHCKNGLPIHSKSVIPALNCCNQNHLTFSKLLIFALAMILFECQGPDDIPQRGCFIGRTTDDWMYSIKCGTIDEFNAKSDFYDYEFPIFDDYGNIISWSSTLEFVPVESCFDCDIYRSIPKLIISETPESRVYHSLVYHDKSGEIVMLGGTKQEGWESDLTDVWTFDVESGIWSEKGGNAAGGGDVLMTSPVYDIESDKLIVFNNQGETWSYDLMLNEWQNKKPKLSPEPRCSHMMSYDAFNDKIVLFSGFRCTKADRQMFNDTWIYDENTNTWTEMNPEVAPGERQYASMVFNSNSKKHILFGGVIPNGLPWDNSLWTYDVLLDIWEKLACDDNPSGPYHNFGVYFDEKNNELIIINGIIYSNPASANEMKYWRFSFITNSWTQFETANDPPAVTKHSMAFHPRLRKAVLFGGFVSYNPNRLLEGTWVLDMEKLEWKKY